MTRSRRLHLALAPVLLVACDSASPADAAKPAAISAAPKADPASAPKTEPTPDPEPIPAAAATEAPPMLDDGDDLPEPEAAPALEEKTVLIMGSSMVATGFGALLQKTLDEHPYVHCTRKAKSATGLARPDFFDWMDVGRRQVAADDPDLVIILLGGNDGQDLQTVGTKKHIVFDTPDWEPAYRARVDEFLTMLTADGAEVMWFGIPRTNTVKLEKKLDMIRGIHKAAVDANDAVHYLDLTPFLEADDGSLMREIRVAGKTREMRGDDGMHLTMAGSRYLADAVVPKVLEAVQLPPADELPPAEDAAPE